MTKFGRGAAAALAASLRRNAALRELNLFQASFAGEESMRLILAALGSSPHRPSLCAVTFVDLYGISLDVPACAALGGSLACGATIEWLRMPACAAGDEGASLIAEGIVAAGPASRMRELHLSDNKIGEKGAGRLVGSANHGCLLDPPSSLLKYGASQCMHHLSC